MLVLVPSLALLGQTLREWRRDRSWPFEALVVCSDPTTSAGVAERSTDEGDGDDSLMVPDWAAVRAQVTTNPVDAERFLRRGQADRAQVVFSTYHSAPVVAAAQQACGAVFDLVICDEAHRLAGAPRAEFAAALDPRAIVARRRLFMTATPRSTSVEGAFSMSDPRVFGPVAHTVSFGDAIRAGLLVDYQVLVVARPATAEADEDPMATAPAALLAAVDQHRVSKVLTFHGRVAKAASFAAALNGAASPAGHRIAARHLSGAMSAQHRAAGLAWLAEPDVDEVRVISNARVLTEGVDVPAVDAVFFADRRSSVIETIQAIGRVLRPSPGKTIGTIIVPIELPDGGDDDTELLLSRFQVLWTVLRGLRSHDQRFAQEIDTATAAAVRHGRFGYRPARLQFILPEGVDEDLLQLRLVQEVGDAWERFYASCRVWAFAHPGRRLPRAARHDELPIGEWAVKQRSAHAAGVLPAERARRLEALPEWYWDRADAAWEDSYSVLRAFADAHNSVAESEQAPSVFAGLKAAVADGRHLGVWLAAQRQAYRDGTLDPARAELLEELPDWTWTPVPRHELDLVDALRQWVDFEHHALVPDGHVEDGLPLGRWVWSVRRRKMTGTLHPALEDEIWAATPSRWRSGPRTRWQWEPVEVKWRLGYAALRAFADREGHARPTTNHREKLPDTTVNVGQWVALQRHQRRHGELYDTRAVALERLPGWAWDGDVGGSRPFEDPIKLPGTLGHGSPGAIAHGCKCCECVTARRTRERAWLAAKRAEKAAAGVSGARARRHLLCLEQQLQPAVSLDSRRPNGGRQLVATTSGVPLGTLRQLAAGTQLSISREHEARLLATTVEACLSNLSHSGSRDRAAQRGQERIDAAPTWSLVHDLQQRGFTLGWIGRELGYVRALQLDPEKVSRRIADQVAELHTTVGDLHAPNLHRNQMGPLLAELKARKAA